MNVKKNTISSSPPNPQAPHARYRFLSIDILRILAIVGVIAIHTTSRTLEQSGFDILRIPFTLFLNQIARFAVPMFFLISGFTLEYTNTTPLNLTRYYKKRVIRILLPYLLWSMLYYRFLYKNPLSSIFSFNFFRQLLFGEAAIQMYFIPSLIILYILFPLLHRFLSFFQKPPVLILCTILQIIILSVDYYQGSFGIVTPVRIAVLNIYLFLIGMTASKKMPEIYEYVEKYFFLLLSLLLVSFGVCLYESRINFLRAYDSNVITSQWRVSIYLYTLTLSALLITKLRNISSKYARIIQKISQLTFFVFFIHIFIISLFWHIIGSYLFSKSASHVIESLWFDPLVIIFVSVISFLIGYLLSFVKKIRWIIGL